MDLRLGRNEVFFKDTFCFSKKKCTNGQNIHDALVYAMDIKISMRIDAYCNFHENVKDLNQNTVVH